MSGKAVCGLGQKQPETAEFLAASMFVSTLFAKVVAVFFPRAKQN